jgi:catechol-2,3-dioxygenase
MLQWYVVVFDAKVQYQNPALAFLTFDEEHHRFAFADLAVIRPEESDNKDDRGMIGVDHVAWEYGSLLDLLENYETLKAMGITPYWCVNHGISASLYYADPDGNQMEFAVDRFATKKECADYFHGEIMGQNPVGVEYDPDDWLARLRSGVPEAKLMTVDPAADVSPIRGSMTELMQ